MIDSTEKRIEVLLEKFLIKNPLENWKIERVTNEGLFGKGVYIGGIGKRYYKFTNPKLDITLMADVNEYNYLTPVSRLTTLDYNVISINVVKVDKEPINIERISSENLSKIFQSSIEKFELHFKELANNKKELETKQLKRFLIKNI